MSWYTSEENFLFSRPRITFAVHRLILINAAVFALQLACCPLDAYRGYALGAGSMLQDWFGFQPGYFLRGMIWTPVTYCFLHGSLMHFFFNMMMLYMLGPEVERTLGTRRFFGFYLLAAGGGVMATFLPAALFGEFANVIGASGAIMGVLVAFVMIDPERQFHLLPLPFPITAVGLLVILVIMNLLASVSETSTTSVATHFGGIAMGYLLMRALPKYNAWMRERTRAQSAKTKPPAAEKVDKLGEAVDNIFKFNDKRRH